MTAQSRADEVHGDYAAHRSGGAALWVLLILNLAWFTPFAVSTGSGIMGALMRSPAWARGAPEASGAGYAFLGVLLFVLLGAAIGYGLRRYNGALASEAATRDPYEHPNAPPLRS